MTSKEIQEVLVWFKHPTSTDPSVLQCDLQRRVHWEIALQLALINEHDARMEARYIMELTKAGLRNQKSGARRKARIVRVPTTVEFKTRAGKSVSMKAVKTEIQNS